MKRIACILCLLGCASLWAIETEQANPDVYLGSAENALMVAQATSVTAQAVTAWPSESREGEFEIHEDGMVRQLTNSALVHLKGLLASQPTVPKSKYGCLPVFRVRLSFHHASKKVELLILLGHGGFGVIDGFRPITGRMHFPQAEEIFSAALLTAYTHDEMKELRRIPTQRPQQQGL